MRLVALGPDLALAGGRGTSGLDHGKEHDVLDMTTIREKPDLVRAAVQNKGDHVDLDALLQADEARRRLLTEVEGLRAELNRVSKEVGRRKKAKEDASELIASTREIGMKIKTMQAEVRNVEARLHDLCIRVPNIPAEDVPVGRDENDNVQVRSWGEPRQLPFEAKAHWDLGRDLDIFDFERAAKLSGSHFALFKGAGARMERALINFMLDLHTTRHGYTEVWPPSLVNRDAMFGTGQLPKLEEDMYRTDEDDLFLIPTAEVPVTNLHAGEVLSRQDLPVYYTAYTPCFRREAGSFGRETRGLLRVHQFDKVELVKLVHPDTSCDELESLLQCAETVLQELGLAYRVLALCTGELSFAAAKCYDIEVWAPGVQRWLEVSSVSNFGDFQARRANIRFRDEDGKVRHVHTLNGSGVALARTILAIVENYQRQDGTIEVPKVLRPYMGGLETIA